MAQNPSPSQLDEREIFQRAFDESNDVIRVTPSGSGPSGSTPVQVVNALITVAYDEIDLTYIVSGNGTGEIGTAVYKNSGTTVATLTLTYDASNNLTNVSKS